MPGTKAGCQELGTVLDTLWGMPHVPIKAPSVALTASMLDTPALNELARTSTHTCCALQSIPAAVCCQPCAQASDACTEGTSSPRPGRRLSPPASCSTAPTQSSGATHLTQPGHTSVLRQHTQRTLHKRQSQLQRLDPPNSTCPADAGGCQSILRGSHG